MEFGSKLNAFKTLYKANIVVCGLETVTLVDSAALDISVEKGGGPNKEIPEAEYSKYFKFDKGTNSADECLKSTYKIVKQSGSDFTDVADDPLIDLKD